MVNTIIKIKKEVIKMKLIKGERRIVIYIFVIMISFTSLYYLYKKFNVKKPIAAKLVYSREINLKGELNEYIP